MHDARLWPASILCAAEGDRPAAVLHATVPAEYTGASVPAEYTGAPDSLAAKLRRSFGQAASPAVEVTAPPRPGCMLPCSMQACFASVCTHLIPLVVLL